MKIVLVDDHEFFRIGVSQFLISHGFQITGQAGTAREGFRSIDATAPNLVLMDIALPGMDGVAATREIGRRAPKTRVLIMTGYSQISDVIDALSAGAAGYALKSGSPITLVEAIQTVGSGLRYVAPSIAHYLTEFDLHGSIDGTLDLLTIREREVFRLACKCTLVRDIARELCLSRKTVDSHLYRINRKLGLRNIAELVRLGANLGMLHSTRPPSVEDFG